MTKLTPAELEHIRTNPFALIFPESMERIEKGLCPTCGKEVGDFRNAISRKEFGISGMCQKCQDSVFGSD